MGLKISVEVVGNACILQTLSTSASAPSHCDPSPHTPRISQQRSHSHSLTKQWPPTCTRLTMMRMPRPSWTHTPQKPTTLRCRSRRSRLTSCKRIAGAA